MALLGLTCAASAFTLAASASHAANAGVSQSAAASYEAFLDQHGVKRANDTVSYATRVSLFQRTLREIEKQNSKPNALWVAGLTRFADYTEGEFKALLGHKPGLRAKTGAISAPSASSSFIQAGPHRRANSEIRIDQLASRIDWRESLQSSKSAKDQGGCGSCWAVAAVGAMEAFAEKQFGQGRPTPPVSFEQLVDCVPNKHECGGTGGCKGATAELAFEWIHKNGLVAEGDYSGYKSGGREGNCVSTGRPILKATGFIRLPENRLEPLMQAVSQQGPVVVSVDAGSGWQNYKSGVFDGCVRDAKVNHAVLLVGYGHDDTLAKDFWVIRNSWGPNWGEHGTIRILRHRAGIENEEAGFCGNDRDPKAGVACKGADGKYPEMVKVCGMCGILSDSSYPYGVHAMDSGAATNALASQQDFGNTARNNLLRLNDADLLLSSSGFH